MKIAHVISRLGAGGAERVMVTLMRAQQAAGHEVTWCALGGGSTSENRLRDLPEPEVMQFSFSRKHVFSRIQVQKQLSKWLKQEDPDVVHSHLWPCSRLVESVAVKSGLPHLVHVHDTLGWLYDRDWRSCWERWRTRLLMHSPAGRIALVAVSGAVARDTAKALGMSVQDFRVVRNGLEANIQSGLERLRRVPNERPNDIVVGAAGRLTRSKGHLELLRAYASVAEAGLKASLQVAGDGEEMEHLRRAARDLLGKQGDAVFRGHLPGVEPFLAGLSIFVLPSLGAEGLSIAQLEAMAAGLPVVVTDVAGAREATEDGVEGFVVPPGDVKAMAGAIRSLAEDRELRQRMGEAGRMRVREQFTEQRMVSEIQRVYEELMVKSANSMT